MYKNTVHTAELFIVQRVNHAGYNMNNSRIYFSISLQDAGLAKQVPDQLKTGNLSSQILYVFITGQCGGVWTQPPISSHSCSEAFFAERPDTPHPDTHLLYSGFRALVIFLQQDITHLSHRQQSLSLAKPDSCFFPRVFVKPGLWTMGRYYFPGRDGTGRSRPVPPTNFRYGEVRTHAACFAGCSKL